MYKVGTCRAPDREHYIRNPHEEIPAKRTHINLGQVHHYG
jgi:hypothetical protein